jgi:uncharacterized membrane protein YkvA (DUF1232 family)
MWKDALAASVLAQKGLARDVALMSESAKDFSEAYANALVPAVARRNERRVRENFVAKLRRVLGSVPFAEDAAAAYFCAIDPATPQRVKAVLFAALAYFVLPVDAIPDIFVMVGFTDDASVLAIALSTMGAAIRDTHRKAARRLLLKVEPATEGA